MRRLLLSAAVLVVAAGCGSDNSVAPTVGLSGSYVLEAVNGQPLPYVFTSDQGTFEVTADQLTLNGDGSYSDLTQLTSATTGEVFQSQELGTYSSLNGSITFFDQTDGIEYSGSLSGSVLTEISAGVTEVFQKQ
jgi:hypothetical protein